jgi:carboxyl-terminal processing protease
LEAGDIIETIDGESVEGTDLVEVVARLDGPEGSNVVIGRTTEGGSTDEVVIERRLPPTPVLEGEIPVDGVGYIRLPDFGADIPQFLHATLAEFEGADALVLDLRDNPGGYVDVATLVASEFLSDGLVMRTEAPGEVLDYPVQEGGLATAGPDLIVVVNGGSASASEILAAVLQERGRATIAGQATFGKDTVQIGFPLVNDGELRVTVARWVTPEGSTVAGVGVVPDVIVEIPPDASPEEVVDLVLG